MEKDFYYYKKLIEGNQLPDDFNQWLMIDGYGTTLAHIAAYEGVLPTDWTDDPKDWIIRDKDRITIAHEAALKNILPTNWTTNKEDWLIEIEHRTIGFIFSSKNYKHYNDPKTLVEYSQNIINHLLPLISNNFIGSDSVLNINNFLNPFYNKIIEQKHDDWIKTSDEYSGFLIDYVETIINQMEIKKYFSIDDDNLFFDEFNDNIEQIKKIIEYNKIEIKNRLFSHHESKHQSIRKDKLDFSNTL